MTNAEKKNKKNLKTKTNIYTEMLLTIFTMNFISIHFFYTQRSRATAKKIIKLYWNQQKTNRKAKKMRKTEIKIRLCKEEEEKKNEKNGWNINRWLYFDTFPYVTKEETVRRQTKHMEANQKDISLFLVLSTKHTG